MSDRFAELLAQGKTGKLSPAELEELARFLNAPVLGHLTSPAVGFVSKHKMVETDVAARIKSIDWFSKCGEPADFDVTMSVERVNTWPDAMKACGTITWENVELEARNQLTMALPSMRDWNELARKFKTDVVTPLTTEVWEPFQQQHGLDVVLIHCAQWDILAAMMENAYMSSNHGSFFFLELLTIYEAGHFPCGWRGDWPQGRLLVF